MTTTMITTTTTTGNVGNFAVDVEDVWVGVEVGDVVFEFDIVKESISIE